MKIRRGFVSNSSSSSFIVKLPKISLNSKDEFAKMLFGDNIPLLISDLWIDYSFATDEIINMVYNDINRTYNNYHSNNIDLYDIKYKIEISEYNIHTLDYYDEIISNKLKDEYSDLKKLFLKQIKILKDKENTEEYKSLEYRDQWKFVSSENKDIYDTSEKIQNIIIESLLNQDNNDYVYLTLEYSDNDGQLMSFIEHSDVLDPITLLKINKH